MQTLMLIQRHAKLYAPQFRAPGDTGARPELYSDGSADRLKVPISGSRTEDAQSPLSACEKGRWADREENRPSIQRALRIRLALVAERASAHLKSRPPEKRIRVSRHPDSSSR